MNDLGLDLLYEHASELLPARTEAMTLERALHVIEAQAFDEVGRNFMQDLSSSFVCWRDPKLPMTPTEVRKATVGMLLFAAFRGFGVDGWHRKQIQHVIPRCFLKLFHDEHRWSGPNRPRIVVPKFELSTKGAVETVASDKAFTHKKRGVHSESVERMLSLIECRFAEKMNRNPDSTLMLENVLAFASMLTARVAAWDRPEVSTVALLASSAIRSVEAVELEHMEIVQHRPRAFSPTHPVREVRVDGKSVAVVPLGSRRTLLLSAAGDYDSDKVLTLQARGQLRRGFASEAGVAFYGSNLSEATRALT